MSHYEYHDQNISNSRDLRAELIVAGEVIPVYTIIGGYVEVETTTITEAQCDTAVANAND